MICHRRFWHRGCFGNCSRRQTLHDSDGAGLDANFTFPQLRAQVAKESILVDDVIQALEKGEGLSGAKWSLSLALDGLHNLPGSEDMSSKNTTFYQTMQAVCQLVNQNVGPLVVGVISATTRVGV